MRRREGAQARRTAASPAIFEPLRDFELALYGRRLLEVHCGADVTFGLLLDWLRPARLVALDIEGDRGHQRRRGAHAAGLRYGPDGSFDAVFVVSRGELKRTLRCFSVSAAARVLVPHGLLVVVSLEPAPDQFTPTAWSAYIDRRVDAWAFLRRSLADSPFEIGAEHLGSSRLLVARRQESPSR
jgi:hypothetical protein